MMADEFGGKSELRNGISGGAGLLEDIRLRGGGRSIRDILPCCEREN
jgi:hypothetical protein